MDSRMCTNNPSDLLAPSASSPLYKPSASAKTNSLRSSANPWWFPAPCCSVSETALQSLDVLPTTLSLPTRQAQTLPTLLNVLQGPSSAGCLLAHPQASVCTLPTRRLDWTQVCIWLMFWIQTLLSEERALPCQELRWLRKDADPADESRRGGWDVMVDLSGPEGGGEEGQHFNSGNYSEAWPNKKKVSALRRAPGCISGPQEQRWVLIKGDILGGPVVRTRHVHCRGCEFEPWSAN